jgi:hypothetical protein
VLRNLDPVHHDGQQVELVETTAEIVVELLPRRRHEVPAGGGLTCPSVRDALHRLLKARFVAPGRHPNKNLVDDPLGQWIFPAERIEARQ